MRHKSLFFAMVFASMLMLMAAATAVADPNTIDTGGGTRGGGPVVRSAAEQALYDQKVKIAQEYAAVRAGKLDYATYAADYNAYAAANGLSSSHVSPNTVTMSENTLALNQQKQYTSYYCGPATAEEILNYLGVTTGPHGESLTQGHLGGSCAKGYLCTDQEGGTDWYYNADYPRPMKNTLTDWSGYQYYVETDMNQWVSTLLSDIDTGFPIASNVREWKDTDGGQYWLAGHPSNGTYTSGHWVAVHGYKNSGNTTYYADSVHGTTFWSWSGSVPAHSYIGNLAFKWLMSNNSRGFIW